MPTLASASSQGLPRSPTRRRVQVRRPRVPDSASIGSIIEAVLPGPGLGTVREVGIHRGRDVLGLVGKHKLRSRSALTSNLPEPYPDSQEVAVDGVAPEVRGARWRNPERSLTASLKLSHIRGLDPADRPAPGGTLSGLTVPVHVLGLSGPAIRLHPAVGLRNVVPVEPGIVKLVSVLAHGLSRIW